MVADENYLQFFEFQWETPPHFELVEPWTLIPSLNVGDPFASASLRATGPELPVRFLINLPRATTARLWITDAMGRRVSRLYDGRLPTGRSQQFWDGRTEHGAAAAAGVYFAHLDTPLGRRTARFVMFK